MKTPMKRPSEQDLYDRIYLLEKQLSIAEADANYWRNEVEDRDREIATLDRALDDSGVYPDEVD